MDKTTTTDIADPKSGDVLIKKGKRLTPVLIQKMKRAGVESVTGRGHRAGGAGGGP